MVVFTAPIVPPADLVRIPAGSVCVGTVLSVEPGSGASGGTNCQYEYRYSTNNGGAWTDWLTDIPVFAGVEGANLVEMRYNCVQACNTNPTAAIQRSWTVVPALVLPVRNGNPIPNAAAICQGQDVSVNITAGSGGGTGAADVYEVSVNGGAFWSAYSSGGTINTDTATGQVLVRVNRTPGTGVVSCAQPDQVIATWNVSPQVIAPTLTNLQPNALTVCQGQNVSASVVAGSGGGAGAADTYRYRINGGAWVAYVSGAEIATTGVDSVEIEVNRSAGVGTGCVAASNSYTWRAYPQIVTPVLDVRTPNIADICAGNPVSATFVAGSGGAPSAVDTFRVSIDNGTSWSNYVAGSSVNTAAATGAVVIEGTRTTGGAAGCGTPVFAELTRWNVFATISATVRAPAVEDCGAAVLLEVENMVPAGIDAVWTLLSGAATPAIDTANPAYFSGLGNGANEFSVSINLNGYCNVILDTVTVNGSTPAVIATLNTQYPVAADICGGDTIRVTIIPGSGGGTGAKDSLQYSIDNGATWVGYTAGADILTTTAVDSVFVIVYRIGGSEDGCVDLGPDTLARWGVSSAPTATVLPPAVDFCAGIVTLEATNVPPGATLTWSLVSGGGGTMSSPSDNPVTITALAPGISEYDLLVSLGPSCQGIVDTVSFNYSNFNDIVSRADVCNACVITDGNTFIFYDGNGRIYATVEDIAPDGGIQLGNTQVCLDYIPHIPATPFQPHVADDRGDWQPYLNRRFSVSPATNSGAIVTLFFYQGEYDSLVSRIDNHFDLDTRWLYKINSTADLRVTKYPGGSGGNYTPPGPGSAGGVLLTPVSVTLRTGAGGNYYEMVLPAISNFSTFYIHPQSNRFPDAPLPVELVSFTATPMASTIMLDWQTMSELNNDRFEVERSTNAVNFSYIGEVPGAGTTNLPQAYKLEDVNVEPGTMYYYRLRIVEFDGSHSYSNIVAAVLPLASGFSLGEFVPNPAKNYSTVKVQTDKETQLGFTLFSLDGREVMKRDLFLEKGVSIPVFDFSRIPAGAYVGQFTTPEGWVVRKLVKID